MVSKYTMRHGKKDLIFPRDFFKRKELLSDMDQEIQKWDFYWLFNSTISEHKNVTLMFVKLFKPIMII